MRRLGISPFLLHARAAIGVLVADSSMQSCGLDPIGALNGVADGATDNVSCAITPRYQEILMREVLYAAPIVGGTAPDDPATRVTSETYQANTSAANPAIRCS